MGLRRKGREIVLQALYNLDFRHGYETNEDITDDIIYSTVLKNILASDDIKPDSKIYDFSETLLSTVMENLASIDDMIKRHLAHWNLDKLAVLDRNLLRIAVGEIIYLKTPPPVAINESLEIAKKFCGEQTGKLLNGVLDNIVKELGKNQTE